MGFIHRLLVYRDRKSVLLIRPRFTQIFPDPLPPKSFSGSPPLRLPHCLSQIPYILSNGLHTSSMGYRDIETACF